MENLLNIFLLSVAFGSYQTISKPRNYTSAIGCVAHSALSQSSWACGYCLDIDQKDNERTVRSVKMENKAECENFKPKEIGKCNTWGVI